MPNPFMRLGTPNQSKRRSAFGHQDPPGTVGFTEGPETPITPATSGEHYAGTNNAYRGIEPHGVKPNTKWHDVDLIDPEDEVEFFDEPEPEPDPIPVRIVTGDNAREIIRATVAHAYANPGTQGRLLGRDLKRKLAKVTNLHATDTVWVSPDPSVQPFTGYPIKAGAEFLCYAVDPLWHISGTANVVELAVYTETAIQE